MDKTKNYVKLEDGSVEEIVDLSDLETTEVVFIGHKANIHKAELTDRNISVLDEKILTLKNNVYTKSEIATEISTAVNNLMHIVCVYSGTQVKIYINDVLKNVGIASQNFVVNTPFRLGCTYNLIEQVLLAQVRLFGFYDSAFTAEQVLSNFNKYSAKGLMS